MGDTRRAFPFLSMQVESFSCFTPAAATGQLLPMAALFRQVAPSVRCALPDRKAPCEDMAGVTEPGLWGHAMQLVFSPCSKSTQTAARPSSNKREERATSSSEGGQTAARP